MMVSQNEVTIIGKTIIPETVIVQNKGYGNKSQPDNSNAVSAGGTRLRRILSNIFHFDNAEIGFLCKRLSEPFTNGKIHAKICQSPRIQRIRIFMSAL